MSCEIIKFTPYEETLNIEILKDFAELDSIKHFIRNNFEEFYFGQKEIIIFNIHELSKELENKKTLLRMLYSEMKQSDLDSELPNLFIHCNKKIHIKLDKVNILEKIVNVEFKKKLYSKYSLRFLNDNLNIVYKFYKTRLQPHIINFDDKRRELELKIDTYAAIDLLIHMLEKENILGKHIQINNNDRSLVSFLYEELQTMEHQLIDDEIVLAYETLGLSQDITDLSIIKQRYYQLAKEHHPDSYYGSDPKIIYEKTKLFIKIKESFGYIKQYLKG